MEDVVGRDLEKALPLMLSPREIEARKRAALADASEQVWWWLSFADGSRPKGSQWLGVSIVRGANVYQAAMNAYALGCNPGGEVAGEPFYEDEITPPPEYTNRLLCEADADALKRLAAAARASACPDAEQEDM